MFNSKLFRLMFALILAFNFCPKVLAVDYGTMVSEEKFKKADLVIVQMNDIRASVFAFYDDNAALPSSLSLLTDTSYIYYTGNTTSAFGTAFTGSISSDGRFFDIKVDVKSAEVASHVAKQLNTQSSGTSVTFSVGSPASSIVDNGFLARNFDSSRPELNEMNTDMSMGNNSISNVNTIDASRVNISDLAEIASLDVLGQTTTLELIVTSDTSLNTLSVNGTASLNDVDVLGAIALNGAATFSDTATFNNETFFNDIATFSDSVNVSGVITANGIEVTNGASIIGGLAVDSLSADTGTISALVSETITTDGLTVDKIAAKEVQADSVVVNGLIQSDSSKVLGDHTVEGMSYLNSLDVTGLAHLAGNLEADGDVTIGGSTFLNGEVIAALGVFLGDSNTFIGQSETNNSVRFQNTTGWVDIGQNSFGEVEFLTDGNGYTFDHKILVQGDDASIGLDVSNGQPEFAFVSNKGNATLSLTTKGELQLEGADLVTQNDIYANELYENNVALKDKYLGIDDTAADADMLDGLSSEDFALADHEHNKLQGVAWQTVDLDAIASGASAGSLQIDHFSSSSSGAPNMTNSNNAVITIGTHTSGDTSQLAFSGDGNMYHRNNTSSWGKVWTSENDGVGSGLDADLLGGKEASDYVAIDVANSFTKRQTFKEGITTASGKTNYLYGKNAFTSSQYDTSGGKSKYAMDLNNSDIIGLNALYFEDSSASTWEGLMFSHSGDTDSLSDYSSIVSYSGRLYFRPDASSTSYIVSDGIDLYENNQKLEDKYFQKTDTSVMGAEKGTYFYGLKSGGSTTNYIRTSYNGMLPYASTNKSYLGTSGWNFYRIYGETIYEDNVSLANKYVAKNENITVSKSGAWLTLDSPSSGGVTTQNAGISIGESGYRGENGLHLTYDGSSSDNVGVAYIGMGAVSSTTMKPNFAAIAFSADSSNVDFLGDIDVAGDIYEDGVKLEDKYELKGGGSDWDDLYTSTTGLGSGNISLKYNYKNYDEIRVIFTNDDRDYSMSHTFTVDDYTAARAINSYVNIIKGKGLYWYGAFSTAGTYFTTRAESARIYKIQGRT